MSFPTMQRGLAAVAACAAQVKLLTPGADTDVRLRELSCGLPRTSLLAAICDGGSLQPVLPQLRLPKQVSEVPLSRPMRAAYSAASMPHMSMHGGTGWNNADSLVFWLRALRAAVRRAAPRRPLLVVMDDCSIHVCDRVLSECVRLELAVVIVPARMTWALQPRGTHVFSRLKEAIRNQMFEAWSRDKGRPGLADQVRQHAQAIRQVLVETD